MRSSHVLFVAALVACLSAPSSAQDARLLMPGEGISRSAGEEPQFYRLPAVAGMNIKVALQSPNQARLSVYSPDGTELGVTEGSGTLSLPLKISADDVYFVAVAAQAGTRYSLTLEEQDAQAASAVAAPGREDAEAGALSPTEPTKPKYVEVPDGSGGTIRLSPEVAARNQAAAEEYKRKLQEHAEAVARLEAEKQAMAARRAEILEKAAEEKREYERRPAEHAAEVAAQNAANRARKAD